MESFDLIIIGAGKSHFCPLRLFLTDFSLGLNGLIVGKTYLEVHPDASLVFFDAGTSIGGVWAKDRLYPGLKTNNLWSTYEFSDFPMTNYGLTENDHIPGSVVYEYLNAFAERYNLTSRIRLNAFVENAEYRGQDGWELRVIHGEQGSFGVHAKKLVVATGLTSDPVMPQLPGMETFGKPLFHTKEWAARAEDISGAATVAVLGSSKSAMDVANFNAARGAKVHWIIRNSGSGPAWTSPIRLTPFKIRIDKLLTARFLTCFSPCIWAVDGYQRFRKLLQNTWLGRKVVSGFFANSEKDVLNIIGYDRDPKTAKLKPRTNLFWNGANVSALNYTEDIMALVRSGQIEVHIADIDHLEEGVIQLSDGSKIPVDALLCATGWKFNPPLHFSSIADEDLGLPLAEALNVERMHKVDSEIFDRFPILANQPLKNKKAVPLHRTAVDPEEPYRLYRFISPPKLVITRNIAFAGALYNLTTSLIAQAQALWITAYFDDRLESLHLTVKDTERSKVLGDIEDETYLHTQFSKRRSPLGSGARHPDLSTDSLCYLDLLLKDLGLKIWRKNNRFWELFQPYSIKDYEGLVTEWMQKQNRGVGKVI